ncbi:MAG: tRNA lysidine(34) synthetase TilS [Lachnospiraceae bacterium]|nr:tRNA lysidine(34) synthetase TilS [Lachnospiraceae bacterium]
MNAVEQKITEFALNKNLIENGDKVLVGLSGGADSVCLFMWLLSVKERFGLELSAVHIHHGIRGEEADRDMEYAKKLCRDNGIDIICEKYNVPAYAKESGLSEEEAGRELRYSAFKRIAENKGYNKIAVAHHADDSAETILFNLLRGSRAKGLTGILPLNGMIIRPLLSVTKNEIESYLLERKVEWCTDSTNMSDEYSRNKIRENIIPVMKEINVQAVRHILDSGEFIGEMYEYLNAEAEKIYKTTAVQKDGKVMLAIKEVASLRRVMRLEVFRHALRDVIFEGTLKDITATHIEAIDGLLAGQSGRRIKLPYGIEICREQEYIYFVKGTYEEMSQESGFNEIEISTTKDGVYDLPYGQGRLHVRISDIEPWDEGEKTLKITGNMYTKCMDCDKIGGVLLLRTRRLGDYLVVNNGASRKKLKEYYIDSKIPARERDKVLVLADGNHVLWVLGYRMSDGCKLIGKTRKQIEFKWEKYDLEEDT